MTTELNWNLVDDIRQLLSFHFMLNALRAGTIVAVVAGAVGYLMVLRRQTFAGHTLALIGFPGAAGATWLGLNTAVGYFGFCVAGALIISALPRRGAPNAGLGGCSARNPLPSAPSRPSCWPAGFSSSASTAVSSTA